MLFIFTVALPTVSATDGNDDIKAAGAKIRIISKDSTNIYVAGARVTIEGTVKKNIWVAGALIDIDTETNGNLHAAGSRVNLYGKVNGKARLAAADLKIDADIGQALNAAAALIEFGGTAKDNLNLIADEVIFSGQTSGSVLIEGRKIQLTDTAHIEGNLIIRSDDKAIISPNATVAGKLTQTGLDNSEFFRKYEDDDDRGFFLLLSSSVFLLGVILIIFARGFVEQGINNLRTHLSRSILWGLILFFCIPILSIVIMISIIGIPIGLATLFLLPFLLILSFTTATLGISDWLLNRNREPKSIGQRLLFLPVGVIILVILSFIPLLGGLLILIAMLLGLGSSAITLGNRLDTSSIEAV